MIDPTNESNPDYRVCHCGILCPVPRRIHRTTYQAHKKKRREAGLEDVPAQFTPLIPVLSAALSASQPTTDSTTVSAGSKRVYSSVHPPDYTQDTRNLKRVRVETGSQSISENGSNPELPVFDAHVQTHVGSRREDGEDVPASGLTPSPHAAEHHYDDSDHDTNLSTDPPPDPCQSQPSRPDSHTLRDSDGIFDDDDDTPVPVERVDDDPDSNSAELADPVPPVVQMEELKQAQAFIDALKTARVDNDALPGIAKQHLRDPLTELPNIDDPILRLSLRVFLGEDECSEKHYENVRAAVAEFPGDISMLSHAQIKQKAQELSGVYPVYTDMCYQGCVGYTGPFAHLDRCPTCGEQRWDQEQLRKGKKVSRQRFATFPVGPQIQAAWRSPESAEAMRYRAKCTQDVLAGLEKDGKIPVYSDLPHSSLYLESYREGHLTDDDTVLMFSIDGAQLYRNKQSDCWIYIWILLDRSPDTRYKNKHILVGGVIPGPHKPGNLDSFLFPGFHHVAALMHEGLQVWDGSQKRLFTSFPFIAFFAADGPGMSALNGFVGHSGAHGCRLYCSMRGRHKPGAGGHYYPASLKPHNYNVVGSTHDDVNLRTLSQWDPGEVRIRYNTNLHRLVQSANASQYARERLETGIAKQSLVSGFPVDCIFPIPECFPADIMHLASLNLTDLLLKLWRGNMPCGKNDNKATWEWAVFADNNLWKTHGDIVASTRPYLPGSFDRPPRNPAEKLTSGYKAVEFLTYIFGLGPAILYGVLPDAYWRNFCKLVRGIRLLHQRHISTADLVEAHTLLIEFSEEFENLYYQRNPERLHFVRQSIHALCHIAPHTIRTGPYAIKSQWPIERTIGALGGQIRQPSNPYANLTQRALRHCQVNAIKHIIPGLDIAERSHLPRGACDLGDDYILLRYAEKMAYSVSAHESLAISRFVHNHNIEYTQHWIANPTVARWARLQLPNGQIARTAWRESKKPLDQLRMSRNVKFYNASGQCVFGEVQYFFLLSMGTGTTADSEVPSAFAMVLPFKPPDSNLITSSSKAFWSCQRGDEDDLRVISVKTITSVALIAPHPHMTDVALQAYFENRYYMTEKLGMDISFMAGITEHEGYNRQDNGEDEAE